MRITPQGVVESIRLRIALSDPEIISVIKQTSERDLQSEDIEDALKAKILSDGKALYMEHYSYIRVGTQNNKSPEEAFKDMMINSEVIIRSMSVERDSPYVRWSVLFGQWWFTIDALTGDILDMGFKYPIID